MAVDHILLRWTGTAAEDLSKKQYYFIELDENGEIEIAEENSRAFVLTDAPKENQPGTYAVAGIVKVIANEEIKAGEPVSVGSEATAVKATATKLKGEGVEKQGTFVVGQALTKAAAKGDLFTMAFASSGRA